jgi:hypothetical protein
MVGTADEYTLEEHGWQNTVFSAPWDVLVNPHWCHERDAAKGLRANSHILCWHSRQAWLKITGVLAIAVFALGA